MSKALNRARIAPPPEDLINNFEVYKYKNYGYNSDMEHHYYFCKKSWVNNNGKIFPRPLWGEVDCHSERSEESLIEIFRTKVLKMTGIDNSLPSCPLDLRKRAAFTLAEVLITLGIIGVVAAITMPALIANYQKKATVKQLKVAYSTFSQAVEKAKLDFGGELPISNDIEIESWRNSLSFDKIYLAPYLKGAIKYTGKRVTIYNKTKNSMFILQAYPETYTETNNGAPMCLPNGFCYWVTDAIDNGNTILLVVDLNGPKGPNVAGRDIFVFQFELNSNRNAVTKLSLPYKNWTHDMIKKGCADKESYSWPGTGQNYYNGITCSTLIAKDNWQISPDYNW